MIVRWRAVPQLDLRLSISLVVDGAEVTADHDDVPVSFDSKQRLHREEHKAKRAPAEAGGGNIPGLLVLKSDKGLIALGGTTLLRRSFVVEVEDDHIVVRVTGTSYAASYYKTENSNDLLARRLPVRDDHRAPMSRLEFIKSAWQLAYSKAQQLKWISPPR